MVLWRARRHKGSNKSLVDKGSNKDLVDALQEATEAMTRLHMATMEVLHSETLLPQQVQDLRVAKANLEEEVARTKELLESARKELEKIREDAEEIVSGAMKELPASFQPYVHQTYWAEVSMGFCSEPRIYIPITTRCPS